MQRLDPDEAREIARLAAERQSGASFDGQASTGPTVEGLATALGLAPSEVERLLAEVRSGKIQTPPFEATLPQRRFGDRSAALSAAIVLALVLVVAALVGARFFLANAAPPVVETPSPADRVSAPVMAPIATEPNDITIDGGDGHKVHIYRGKGGASVKIDDGNDKG